MINYETLVKIFAFLFSFVNQTLDNLCIVLSKYIRLGVMQMLVRYIMVHYLISRYQAINTQRRLACIGLQHVHLSWKIACVQLEITWYSPQLINMMNLQNGRYQWQALTKYGLVFPVQEMNLVSACIWNENTSNIVHN